MRSPESNEIIEIKNKLVDISLIVISIAGIPLLATSIFREITLRITPFWYSYASIYTALLIVTLLRHRLKYSIKANLIIFSITLLGTLDLI